MAKSTNPDAGQPAADTSGVPKDHAEAVAALAKAREEIVSEIGKIIIGQRDVIDQVLTAFFARGHCVIEGVPGLAKTLMISSLARTMSLDFTRVQFTPDLMPTDITGTSLLNEDEHGHRHFMFSKGPVFTNILLADEINRTPPKTQAALLESMQERNVSVGGETYPLPEPFLVLATQNPIEQEGTYPLPEAQLDRFLFLIKIDYPSLSEEEEILLTTTLESLPDLDEVINGPSILDFQKVVRDTEVHAEIANYAARIPRATRPGTDDAPEFINNWVRWGCGPRAGQALILAAKSHCALHGRQEVTFEDIRRFVHPILRHRMVLNFAAVSEGYNTDDIITMLLKEVPETGAVAQTA
jgi:MoxR-like ATPase